MREDEKTTSTIIPATSGWFMGELVGPRQEIEEATSLDIRPIIAWEVERMQGDVSTHFSSPHQFAPMA